MRHDAGAPWAKARAPQAETAASDGWERLRHDAMQSMSTTGTSTAAQAVTTLDEQATPAADSTERPLTTADRCDVCDAQAFVRVVMLTGELFFCGHHANAHLAALVATTPAGTQTSSKRSPCCSRTRPRP